MTWSKWQGHQGSGFDKVLDDHFVVMAKRNPNNRWDDLPNATYKYRVICVKSGQLFQDILDYTRLFEFK